MFCLMAVLHQMNQKQTVLTVRHYFCNRSVTLTAECQTGDYLRLVAEVSAELSDILENSHIMFSAVIPELGG